MLNELELNSATIQELFDVWGVWLNIVKNQAVKVLLAGNVNPSINDDFWWRVALKYPREIFLIGLPLTLWDERIDFRRRSKGLDGFRQVSCFLS